MAMPFLMNKMSKGHGPGMLGLIGGLLDKDKKKPPVAGAGARLMARDPVVPQHNPLAL